MAIWYMIGQTAHILVVVTHSWGGKRTLDEEPFFATKSFVFGGLQLALSQPFTTSLLNPISRHPWLSLSLWTRFCVLSFCWILLSLSIDAWCQAAKVLEWGMREFLSINCRCIFYAWWFQSFLKYECILVCTTWRWSNLTHILELGWNHQLYNYIVHTVIMYQVVVVDIYIDMPNDLTLKSLFDVLFIYILHHLELLHWQPSKELSWNFLHWRTGSLIVWWRHLGICPQACVCVCVFVYKCLQTFQEK